MGTKNQKSEKRGRKNESRRLARKAKEETRQNGAVVATTDPPGLALTSPPASVALMVVKEPAPAPVSVAVKTPPAAAAVATVVVEKRKETPTTKANKPEYDNFFRIYSLAVKSTIRCFSLTDALAGKKGGLYFLPLGFIPGPAILLNFRDGQVQGTEATPNVKEGMQIPTPWQKVETLPSKMLHALAEWQSVVEGIGYEPSPWNLGFAQGILGGQLPSKYLAMTMPHFRYRPGDLELPFGVVLTPMEKGMKLVQIYNPRGIPDVPTVDTVLTLDELKNSRGPIQKLLRTWALMEGNFLGRYDRDGQPRPANGQPQPQPQFRRPSF